MVVRFTQQLKRAIHNDPSNCVLFVGAGLSTSGVRKGGNGLPDWDSLTRHMIEDLRDSQKCDAETLRTLEERLKDGKHLEIAALFKKRTRPDQFDAFLKEELDPPDIGPSKVHEVILKTNFRGIITTNFDMVFECQSHPRLHPLVYPQCLDDIDSFRRHGFFAKIHGCIRNSPRPLAENLVLTEEKYAALRMNQKYRAILHFLFLAHPLLTVGFSLRDPDFLGIMDDLRGIFSDAMPTVYALMPDPGQQARNEWLEKGVEIVPYENHEELTGFFEEMLHAPQMRADPQRLKRDTRKSGRPAAVTGEGPAVSKPLPSGKQSSIAVLPFANLSGNSADEYFSDGVSEEIINALSKLEGLRVAARTSSFSFKGRAVEITEIARKLGVSTVLEGSVRKAGNRIRITAQLVNVADGFHLWSERYDREMEDIFAVQDEIARSIADRLKVTLKDDQQQPLVKAGTDNLEAYQLYLKGRALLYQTGRGVPRALECLKRAVALDDKYALAWAGLADVQRMSSWYGFVRPEASLPHSKESATRAVALDPSLAEAHTALAQAYSFCDWNWSNAEREFLRALELNPRYVQALEWYGVLYLQAVGGRFDEGIAHAKKAVEFDPLSGYANACLAWAYAFAGRTDEGLAAAQHAVDMDAESILAQLLLASTLYLQSRFEDSIAIAEAALGMFGRNPLFMALMALAYADWGKPAYAKSVNTELLGRSAREYVSPILLAISAAAIGELDEAMRYAQQAYAIHDPQLTTMGRHWPGTKRLREDSRFTEILASMGSETSGR